MSQIVLKNDTITVAIDNAGAEMTSIQSAAGQEYLWSGDPQYWKRHAPVLFPLVGSVWNKEFRVGEKTYAMEQHGFARDMEFTVIDATETEAWFRLTSNEETLAKYPYEFVLEIDDATLVTGALKGMMAILGDPYTHYYTCFGFQELQIS